MRERRCEGRREWAAHDCACFFESLAKSWFCDRSRLYSGVTLGTASAYASVDPMDSAIGPYTILLQELFLVSGALPACRAAERLKSSRLKSSRLLLVKAVRGA